MRVLRSYVCALCKTGQPRPNFLPDSNVKRIPSRTSRSKCDRRPSDRASPEFAQASLQNGDRPSSRGWGGGRLADRPILGGMSGSAPAGARRGSTPGAREGPQVRSGGRPRVPRSGQLGTLRSSTRSPERGPPGAQAPKARMSKKVGANPRPSSRGGRFQGFNAALWHDVSSDSEPCVSSEVCTALARAAPGRPPRIDLFLNFQELTLRWVCSRVGTSKIGFADKIGA